MKPWEICKICEQCYYHFLRWRNDQNKSCTSWWVVQLSCSWLFHMKSFGVSKCCLNLPFFEIPNWNGSNRVAWKVFQNKSCRFYWDLQLLCSWIFHLTSFGVWKSCLNFPFFEIQILNCTNKVTWKVLQNKSWWSWRVL